MNTVSMTDISVFDKFEVRKVWHKDQRYFPVNDIVFVLTESKNTVDYIKKMKIRDPNLLKGWGQIVTPL
jgi:DNA-damage-inducible protein D